MEFVSLNKRISNIAKAMPKKIAIECGEKSITYSQLEEISSEIGEFLYGFLNEKNNIISFLDKGPELIQTLLGIIKSGGVFVPIDPVFPDERISLMISEVESEWIITTTDKLNKVSEIINRLNRTINVLVLDGKEKKINEYKNLNLFSINDFSPKKNIDFDKVINRYCYIYFTSGSTGKPKGVVGRHRSLSHFIEWEINELGVDETFKVSQLTPQCFDPFLRDVFVPLASGGTLCIPENRDILMNSNDLVKWINIRNISLIHMVPSLFRIVTRTIGSKECFKSLKYIALAGEMLKGNDIKPFFDLFGDRIQLINFYGPTETTLSKFFYRIKECDVERINIPVGKPISYTEGLILDNELKKCPVGNPGELYIRTPFISSGYYNMKDVTKKTFITNPFSDIKGDIIYKTGDLGRMLPNGNIELLGRIDNQVKINGIRIELGEIENQLLSHIDVDEAVVIAKEDINGNKSLCAYIVSEKEIKIGEMREYLSRVLPDYMLPSHFVKLEKMPLNSSGKIDRKALNEYKTELYRSNAYKEPDSILEKKIAAIWQEALGIERVGVYDNFYELGGNSLMIIKVQAEIEKLFPGKIKVTDLFIYTTVSMIAEFISRNENKKINIKSIKLPKEYFVSLPKKNTKSEIRYNINEPIYGKIGELAELENIKVSDIFLGMFIYLFTEVTENSENCIQVINNDEGRVLQLTTDLNEAEDLLEFFKIINTKQIDLIENAYDISEVINSKVVKDNEEIIPLFCNNYFLTNMTSSLDIFDMIMSIEELENSFYFTCEYNTERLSQNKVEEMFDGYFNMIDMIVDQFFR